MLELMIIINHLNAANRAESNALCKNFDSMVMALDHGYQIRRLSPLYGKISICHDLVMFHVHNWLVDRNTLLMYKDICIARFHCLLAIEHRLYPKYQDDLHNGAARRVSEVLPAADPSRPSIQKSCRNQDACIWRH